MNILSEIKYTKPNIGYFPALQKYFTHGFSWGDGSGNYSYALGERTEVYKRNLDFFNKLDLGSPRKAILLVPEHKTNIVILEEKDISKKGHFSGINIKCDSIFTFLKDVTINVKVADCQTYFLYGSDRDGKILKGLVHSGWRGTNAMFSKKVLETLINQHGILPESILIGLVPGIFQKDRTIQNFSTIDGDLSHWGDRVYFKNGDYHLDSRNFTIDQLLDMGVKEENIYVYDLNTFEYAKKGHCFSQKLEYLEENDGREIEKGRFIVSMRT